MKTLLSLLGFGVTNVAPVYDLHKKEKPGMKEKINSFVERNFGIIALITLIVMLFLFIAVCFFICGVSAVESGTVYNHFQEVI